MCVADAFGSKLVCGGGYWSESALASFIAFHRV